VLGNGAVLAFGTERGGLTDALLARADARVALPMQPGVSSLNLATSVSAVLYAGGSAAGRRSARRRGAALLGLRAVELLVEELDRLLELGDRRRLDRADAALAVEPPVDLVERAAVDAPQRPDELVALGAQGRAPLEGRQGRLVVGLGLGDRTALGNAPAGGARAEGIVGAGDGGSGEPKSAICGATSAASGTKPTSSGSVSTRGRARAGRRRAALVAAVVLGVQVVAQLGLDVGGQRAQPAVGGQEDVAELGGRPATTRTKRPTIWRKISGVLATVA
jgi:hypothetical protein